MAQRDVNILIRARDEASRNFRRIARSALGLVGAFVGFRSAVRFVRGSVDVWNVQAVAVNNLRAALTQLGAASQTAEMERFAAQLQRITTIGDETTLEVMRLGASLGKLSGEQLQEATVAAMGLSRTIGVNLETAMRLVSRAAVGDTAQLKRYGIVLDASADATERFGQLLRIGRDNFAMVRAETTTFAGRMAQLRNALGDAREQLGKMIVSQQRLTMALDIGKTALENLSLTWDIVKTATALSLVSMAADVKHFFVERLGGYMRWFLDNRVNLMRDMAALFKAVLTNLLINAGRFATALWDAVRGRGWEFAWQPLADGFERTMAELPTIAARQMTDVERVLTDELAELTDRFRRQMVAETGLPEFAGGGPVAAAGRAAAAARGTAAVESRFMAGTSMAIDYDKQQLEEQRQQRRLLENIDSSLAQIARADAPAAAMARL